MAKVSNNDILDKHIDWAQDPINGLPYSGRAVQKFIKEQIDSKAGVFYYDTTNNRYLVFTDAETRDDYILDPTKTELIIGTFDAPFNYTAEISLTTPTYNAVFLGSTGNYIDFTFDVKNKQGASTGENVLITYTFIRNATKRVVKETRRYGDSVHFNVDKYIDEGTNTIIVGVTGQTTLAATTIAITYQVVNLSIIDSLDISKSYNLKSGSQTVEIPFTVSGYGTKIVEWYLDGELLDFVKAEDEVVDISTTRTKYITLSNLSQGRHSLQIRAYTVINGENFYTDTLYRDLLVYTGASNEPIIGVAATLPRLYGILGANDPVVIYDMVQYVPYNLRFATYSPTNASNTEVTVKLDNVLKGTVSSVNNEENVFSIVPTTSGDKTLELKANDVVYTISAKVETTSMNLEEITIGLILDFNAIGKTNNSDNKDQWAYSDYTGTFSGFNWNSTSGWVNNRLEMNAGSSFGINIAPLSGNPTNNGKTIEIEWSTKNVANDNAIICDLRNENGVGILITATKVTMTSADGVVVETEYKSEENVRIGFVINPSSGATNQRLSFIYANGIVSRGEKWSANDSYTSDAQILFNATAEAEISLKAIRIYNTALSSDQMLNNFTLYRDTIEEMMTVYDRNDVYVEGTTTFSPDKMMSRLPVMIVTGDIPTLENTSDKDTQIIVDIEYYNMQDTDKNFRMTGAAMRPQGTSSMGYPKKNFRIYTQKVDGTVFYDSNDNVVESKLYSFKDGAQPVDCWCLKADYAESSGTHNTGIARLWNDALLNAQVDGEYVCRTEAQKAALASGYEYDVRTTIDGFPILLFYRPKAGADIIFIGKYNFNNDKSTESVFGFVNIPNFDNSRMQCWEVLNNGNPLALFTTVSGFDGGWSEAFESRYPDTKYPNTSDLKAFCQWMVNVTQKDFASQKWEHLNVYMMAAYWCYLMRHAGADQFVKNAMFTSEDGKHFYYILYDNDTINGLINTGRLRIKPTDDRQTVDENGEYVFAGHDSRLWNMLEADEEFKNIVSAVDNALYSAGISYANTIAMFDDEQADKWVEKVYNQDAQYKYVGPYVEKGIDNLFMLQGKRDLHRRWWLAKRFSIYDAKYVSGTYKSQAVELKCLNDTVAGQQFSITAGYPLDYGYGINNIPRSFGITLGIGDTHTFTTEEKVNLGDPIRIYGAPHLAEIDFSQMSDRLAVLTITNVYDEALNTKLTKLVVGNRAKTNYELAEISGLRQAVALEYLDVQGMTKINSIDLSYHPYFKTLKAFGSGVSSITFAKGAPVTTLELPSSMRVLTLQQLPYLTVNGIALESVSNISGITITQCPNLSNDFNFIHNWLVNKTTSDAQTSLIMDGVNWSGVSSADFERIVLIASNGGNLSLKGKVSLINTTIEQAKAIERAFGESVFDEMSDFYVEIPTLFKIYANDNSLLEGESTSFTYDLIPKKAGNVKFNIVEGRTGCTINPSTGVLTTNESALDTSTILVRGTFTPSDGSAAKYDEVEVEVVRRTYPTITSIIGNPILGDTNSFTWAATDVEEANGEYIAEWVFEGDVTNHFSITSTTSNGCTIVKNSMPTDTVEGNLTIKIVRNFDGEIASSKTITVKYVMPHLKINITSNQSNDTVISAVKATVKYGDKTSTLSNGQTLALPLSTLVTISFPSVVGYSKPNDISYTTSNEDKEITATYNTTIVTVVMDDNQTTLNDVATATAIVSANGIANATVGNGETVKIPSGVSCSITWRDVDGYRTPDKQTFTASGTGMTKTGTYQTELLTITVTSDIELPTGYTITISNVGSQTTETATYKVPFGLAYTVQGSQVAGYITPTTQTFIANSASRSVTVEYLEKSDAIVATIKSTSSTSYTYLFKHQPSSTYIASIKIDGTPVKVARGYMLSVGEHIVKITLAQPTMGHSIFEDIESLVSVVFPDELVASFGDDTFSGCSSLKSVTIGKGITSFGSNTFYGCYSLTSITIGNGITSMGNNTFYNCRQLTSVTLPQSLTKVPYGMFSGCSKLTNVTLSSVTTQIDQSAFKDCSSLTNITIPSGVTRLSEEIFYGCSSLTNITIPNSVTKIDENAFRKCSSLTNVTIPSSVSSFSSYGVFAECPKLAKFNGKYASSDGRWLINGTLLLAFAPAGLTECTIPNGVKTIGGSIFYNCTSLTSITIPDGVTYIYEYAFYSTSLTSITIPDSVTYIYKYAFNNCRSLASATIGNGITSIQNGVFSYCLNLKTIYCNAITAPSTSDDAFGASTSTYTGRNTYNTGENKLYVPSGATGYNIGPWLDPLQKASACGFTLSATL